LHYVGLYYESLLLNHEVLRELMSG